MNILNQNHLMTLIKLHVIWWMSIIISILFVANTSAQTEMVGKFFFQNDGPVIDSLSSKVIFSSNDTHMGKQIKIIVRDEKGEVLTIYDIPPERRRFEFTLNDIGYYLLSAEDQNKSTMKTETSAVVAGFPLKDRARLQSSLGLWHVHGKPEKLISAGAGWTRLTWSLNAYCLNNDGRIIPQPSPKPNPTPNSVPLSMQFNIIGMLAYGFPPWMNHKASDHAIYLPENTVQLSELAETFARDVRNFPPYFELYNEPESSWKGSDQELVNFFRIIGTAIKKVHPSTKILVPGMATINLPRLKRLAELGLFDGMDGLVIHAYVNGSAPEGEFIQKFKELKSFLTEIGKPDYPVFITEFGWTTKSGTWQRPVDELTQAQYVARSLVLLQAEGIKAAVYFCLGYKAKNDGESGFSLLRTDGTPKPAFAAYSNTARWLAGTSLGRSIMPAPNKHLVLFVRDNGTAIAVAWSENSDSPLFLPGFSASRMVDMTGRSISPRSIVKAGASPVFWEISDPRFVTADQEKLISTETGTSIRLSMTNMVLPSGISERPDGRLEVSASAKKGTYLLFGKQGRKWKMQPLEVR